MSKRVYLYDSTLRDGAQTRGVDFGPADKAAIARELDTLGIDYIEGGWPGANPTDDVLFGAPPPLVRARLSAFGMTCRPNRAPADDPAFMAVIGTGAPVACIVGKTWDFHVDVALGVPREENLRMISESLSLATEKAKEVLFDAEHFFDGYKANPSYALECLGAAREAGASWLVLCDTNGGTLPYEVEEIVAKVAERFSGEYLGIHCHDDTGNAVANSLAAVRAGARHVQGTLNGLGERCGNANLISILPSLVLKMGYETGVDETRLKRLTHISRFLDERLNRAPQRNAPYVGEAAFAHKGGLHVSAVAKDPASYEHVAPEQVGNSRFIVVSDQAGKSNILTRLHEIGMEISPDHPKLGQLISEVKQLEHDGYAYDGADASFELLARRSLENVPSYFRLNSFRVIDERRWNARNELITLSEATVKVEIGKREIMTVAEGNGPVNALDTALRRALSPVYEELADLRLVDYKVRILTPESGTGAVTRVMIESADGEGSRWSTVGVSANVINASFNAMYDAIVYKLYRDGASDLSMQAA